LLRVLTPVIGTDLPTFAVQEFSQLLEVFETQVGHACSVRSKVDAPPGVGQK